MKFATFTNEELSDIWYALAGAEIRHPGRFSEVLEASNDELLKRMGTGLAPFLDDRFRELRAVDAAEDVRANRAAS
jgi:rubrerythrin